MAEEKNIKSGWYNSAFGTYSGLGLLLLGLSLGVGGCEYLSNARRNPPVVPVQLQRQVISNAQGDSRIIEIYDLEGRAAVTSVDSEPIINFIKKSK